MRLPTAGHNRSECCQLSKSEPPLFSGSVYYFDPVICAACHCSPSWWYRVLELWRSTVHDLAKRGGAAVIFLSGDGKPDPELEYLSSFGADACHGLSAYLDAGGMDNARAFLMAACDLLDDTDAAPPPRPLLKAGIYWPEEATPDIQALANQWTDGAPCAAIVFTVHCCRQAILNLFVPSSKHCVIKG